MSTLLLLIFTLFVALEELWWVVCCRSIQSDNHGVLENFFGLEHLLIGEATQGSCLTMAVIHLLVDCLAEVMLMLLLVLLVKVIFRLARLVSS